MVNNFAIDVIFIKIKSKIIPTIFIEHTHKYKNEKSYLGKIQ